MEVSNEKTYFFLQRTGNNCDIRLYRLCGSVMNSIFELDEQLELVEKTELQLVHELNRRMPCYIIDVFDISECMRPHAVSEKYMAMRKEIVKVLEDWGANTQKVSKCHVIFKSHRRRRIDG